MGVMNWLAVGPPAVAGKWYQIDVRILTNGTTWSIDAEIDGVTYGGTRGSLSAINTLFEINGFANVTPGDSRIDNLMYSITTGDYPIGPGRVLLAPLEGTTAHQSITTTEWQSTSDFSSFSNFTGNAETVTPPLLGPPISTATPSGFRMNAAGAPAGNGRWPITVPVGSPNTTALLVSAIVAVRESAAGTNNAVIRAELAASLTNIFATANPGWGTTWNYLAARMSVGPGSAAWTPANVEALNIEFDSTDANPNIWCQGICVEVAYRDRSLLLPNRNRILVRR
jgi:hypothetical protein